MSRLPVIRCHAGNGALLIREGVSICFYLRRAHEDVLPSVMSALDTYLRAVGPDALGWYTDLEGEWQELDADGWAAICREARAGTSHLFLSDTPSGASRYAFEYYDKSPRGASSSRDTSEGCAVAFWLPTELIQERGPAWVRAFALEVATQLSFTSGHAGLAFNALTQLIGVSDGLRPSSSRYPAMDVPDLSGRARHLGTRVPGVHWLTFLGSPVLEALGGAAGLRSRLASPGSSVQELDSRRALVTLGEWPEAGDTERGDPLPAYRELARVLEPWLYRRPYFGRDPREEAELRRWERRFLD